jgi:hypothetical protein
MYGTAFRVVRCIGWMHMEFESCYGRRLIPLYRRLALITGVWNGEIGCDRVLHGVKAWVE